MRAVKAVIALFFIIAGIIIGALNQQVVEIDLFFAHTQAHFGLALLISLLIGALLGGALVSFSLLFKNKTSQRIRHNSQPKASTHVEPSA